MVFRQIRVLESNEVEVGFRRECRTRTALIATDAVPLRHGRNRDQQQHRKQGRPLQAPIVFDFSVDSVCEPYVNTN